MSQLEEYNLFVQDNVLIESLLPCADSNLSKKYEVVFENTRADKNVHVMVNRCRQRRSSYFTCIQYREEVSAVSKHVCDIFPVMIGSMLDISICNLFDPSVGACDAYQDLSGMIFVDGSLAYMPYLLTNRKELGHKVKRSNGLFCLYIYDIENRGHKLSIDSKNEFMYRNQRGENATCIDETANFMIDNRHLNLNDIKHAFIRIYNHPIDIDSLENKLTLSPVNILNLMLIMAQRNPSIAREYIVRGELEKFASVKIIYSEAASKRNSWASSFNYRKLQPNQILKTTNINNIHNMERIVVRPIPKNVSKASIPKNTEYFLCLAEKSIAIDSPNRWLLLLPNVMVANTTHITQYTLNHLLDELLLRGHVKQTLCYTDANECLVLVNGGLLTHYSLTCDFDTLLFTAKSANPYIEIFKTDDFVMFNLTRGIPFIPFIYKGKSILISPLELNTVFKSFKNDLDSTLFGPNCLPESIEMAQYATLNKMMVATNYFKNRFTSNVSSSYFEYTAENMCAYIDVNNSNFNKSDSLMNFNMIFSSHPQITADSYILDKNINCNSDIFMRSRLDIDIQTHMNIFFNEDISHDGCFADYDSIGNVIRKYICILKIQKIKDALRFRIFPQTKLFMSSVKTSSGYDHYLYKYFDERYQLENEFDMTLSVVCNEDKKKKRLYIDLVTRARTDFYDGFKLSDQCSQKGLVVRQDVSRYPMKPQLVGSIFSIIGRSPIIELKSIAKNSVPCPPDLPNVLYGNYTFAVLKNISAVMKSFSPLKIDIYSSKILSTNGLHYTLYSIQQDAFKAGSRGVFLPDENQNAISLLSNLKIAIEYKDSFGNKKMEMSFLKRKAIVEVCDVDTKKKHISIKEQQSTSSNEHYTPASPIYCAYDDAKKQPSLSSHEYYTPASPIYCA